MGLEGTRRGWHYVTGEGVHGIVGSAVGSQGSAFTRTATAISGKGEETGAKVSQ